MLSGNVKSILNACTVTRKYLVGAICDAKSNSHFQGVLSTQNFTCQPSETDNSIQPCNRRSYCTNSSNTSEKTTEPKKKQSLVRIASELILKALRFESTKPNANQENKKELSAKIDTSLENKTADLSSGSKIPDNRALELKIEPDKKLESQPKQKLEKNVLNENLLETNDALKDPAKKLASLVNSPVKTTTNSALKNFSESPRKNPEEVEWELENIAQNIANANLKPQSTKYYIRLKEKSSKMLPKLRKAEVSNKHAKSSNEAVKSDVVVSSAGKSSGDVNSGNPPKKGDNSNNTEIDDTRLEQVFFTENRPDMYDVYGQSIKDEVKSETTPKPHQWFKPAELKINTRHPIIKLGSKKDPYAGRPQVKPIYTHMRIPSRFEAFAKTRTYKNMQLKPTSNTQTSIKNPSKAKIPPPKPIEQEKLKEVSKEINLTDLGDKYMKRSDDFQNRFRSTSKELSPEQVTVYDFTKNANNTKDNRISLEEQQRLFRKKKQTPKDDEAVAATPPMGISFNKPNTDTAKERIEKDAESTKKPPMKETSYEIMLSSLQQSILKNEKPAKPDRNSSLSIEVPVTSNIIAESLSTDKKIDINQDKPIELFKATDNNIKYLTEQFGLVLVFFYSPFCRHCRTADIVMKKATHILSRQNRQFLAAQLDVIENQKCVQEWDVRGVPSVYIFRNGEIVEKFVGHAQVSEIIEACYNPRFSGDIIY